MALVAIWKSQWQMFYFISLCSLRIELQLNQSDLKCHCSLILWRHASFLPLFTQLFFHHLFFFLNCFINFFLMSVVSFILAWLWSLSSSLFIFVVQRLVVIWLVFLVFATSLFFLSAISTTFPFSLFFTASTLNVSARHAMYGSE